MADSHRSPQLRHARRNFSDMEGRLLFVKNREEAGHESSRLNFKSNSIKINPYKLPHDFFSKTEPHRKKLSLAKPTEAKRLHKEIHRKTLSIKDETSPEKTSFFGFFSENNTPPQTPSNTLSIKRKFESRDEPKRDKINVQSRKFTPMNGIHRNNLLSLYPDNYNTNLGENIVFSARARGILLNVRGQDFQSREIDKISGQGPATETRKASGRNIIEDVGNITFFNSKSNILPPIHQVIN